MNIQANATPSAVYIVPLMKVTQNFPHPKLFHKKLLMCNLHAAISIIVRIPLL